MTGNKIYRQIFFWLIPVLFMEMFVLYETAHTQEEVASAIRRYKEREYSTGYYEEYEALPRSSRSIVGVPGVKRGVFPYSPFGAEVRIRTRLADSHQYIKFYENLRCEFCHINETKSLHTTRAGLTCRQCHGGEPIAGIDHFYSPMNPIRRHAYVCAKCHQGATASFASYVIHEPPASSPEARRTFPLLYYSYWFMFLLFAGVIIFFIPHSLMGFLQELAVKRGKRGIDIAAFFIPKKYRDIMVERISSKISPAMEKFYSMDGNDFMGPVKNILIRKPKNFLLYIKQLSKK